MSVFPNNNRLRTYARGKRFKFTFEHRFDKGFCPAGEHKVRPYNDYFGFSVAISDDYAFVGAYADDHQQTDTGSVYIFKRSGTTWSQTQKNTPVDGS
jgi:hypothetical protein